MSITCDSIKLVYLNSIEYFNQKVHTNFNSIELFKNVSFK